MLLQREPVEMGNVLNMRRQPANSVLIVFRNVLDPPLNELFQ
jgi:hypothetical protein